MKTPCGICESTNTRRILVVDSFEILECKKCLNAFTNPRPNDFDYENLDFNQKNTHASEPRSLESLPINQRENYFLFARFLEDNIPNFNTKRVLDVGSGEGIFANILIDKKVNCSVLDASNISIHRAKKRGLDTYHGVFENMYVSEKFDVFTFIHSLEHMKDVQVAIRKAKQSSIGEFYVLLVQTNYKGVLPKFQGRNWYAWVPDQHFWHFSISGLINIFSGEGFEAVNFGYTSLNHDGWIGRWNRVIKLFPPFRDQLHILFKYRS